MTRKLLAVLAVTAVALTVAIASTSAASPQMFVTPLSGDEEVPPRETQAHGVAIFQLSPDGTELSYRLIASNIENVVAFLFEAESAGGGRHDGVLSTGTITAADLVGPLAGMPLSALIGEMEAGNTYVNVHTNDGVAPTNTGPGDFPGGEIRGQLD